MDYSEKRQTQFNAGIASLERIHNLLIKCNEYSTLSRVDGLNMSYLKAWRLSILSLLRELSPKIEKKDMKTIYNMLKKSKEIGSILFVRRTDQGMTQHTNPLKFYKHWELLDRIETKLRKCADEKGILIPDKIYDQRFSAAD